jgi:tRNA-modifying protein YgfZ
VSPSTLRIARRLRAYIRVAGPDAADYLERMVSNEVESLAPGESREALLLTPKARVIAPLRVLRRDEQDFLLLTEPELGESVRATLARSRFAAKVEIEPEDHRSYVTLDRSRPQGQSVPSDEYGAPAWEVIGGPEPPEAELVDDAELERMRIAAGTPAWGKEIDERVLPAEAGLVERAVSFTKGCYPGQEPIARQHHRGRVNRRLRVLELADGDSPPRDAEIRLGEKVVGRVTSAVPGLALGYVRVEVPDDAELEIDGASARLH